MGAYRGRAWRVGAFPQRFALLWTVLLLGAAAAACGGDDEPEPPPTDTAGSAEDEAEETPWEDEAEPGEPVPTPAQLAVRVLADGAPLSNARVTVDGQSEASDGAGDTFFPHVRPGRTLVRVEASGRQPRVFAWNAMSCQELALEFDLAPEPLARLVPARDDVTLQDADVELAVDAADMALDDRTRALGVLAWRFAVHDASDARFELEARLDSGARVQLYPGRLYRVDVRDESGMAVRPNADATWTLSDSTLEMNEAWRVFWLDELEGTWRERPFVSMTQVDDQGISLELPAPGTWALARPLDAACRMAVEVRDQGLGLPDDTWIRLRDPSGVVRSLRDPAQASGGLAAVRTALEGVWGLEIAWPDGTIEHVGAIEHRCPGTTTAVVSLPAPARCTEPGCEGDEVLEVVAREGLCRGRDLVRVRTDGMPAGEWRTVPSHARLAGAWGGSVLHWEVLSDTETLASGSERLGTCPTGTCLLRARVEYPAAALHIPMGGCRPQHCPPDAACVEVIVLDERGAPVPNATVESGEAHSPRARTGDDGRACLDLEGAAGRTVEVWALGIDATAFVQLPSGGQCGEARCARQGLAPPAAEARCPEGFAQVPLRSALRMGVRNPAYMSALQRLDPAEGVQGIARLAAAEAEAAALQRWFPEASWSVDDNGSVEHASVPVAHWRMERDAVGRESRVGLMVRIPLNERPPATPGQEPLRATSMLVFDVPWDDTVTLESLPTSGTLTLVSFSSPQASEGQVEAAWSVDVRAWSDMTVGPGRVDLQAELALTDCAPCLDEDALANDFVVGLEVAAELHTSLAWEPDFRRQLSHPLPGAWARAVIPASRQELAFGPAGAVASTSTPAALRWCAPTDGSPVYLVGEPQPGLLVPISPVLFAQGNLLVSLDATSEFASTAATYVPRWWEQRFIQSIYRRLAPESGAHVDLRDVATVLGQAVSEQGAPLPVVDVRLEDLDGNLAYQGRVMTAEFREVEAGASSFFAVLSVQPVAEVEDRLVLRVFGPDGEYAFLRQGFVPAPGSVLLALD